MAKRIVIIAVIQINIDDLRYHDRNAARPEVRGGELRMGPMSRAQTSRPKPPKQALAEMDGGTEGLGQVFPVDKQK